MGEKGWCTFLVHAECDGGLNDCSMLNWNETHWESDFECSDCAEKKLAAHTRGMCILAEEI